MWAVSLVTVSCHLHVRVGDGIEECAGELLDAEAGGGEKAVVHAHGVGCAVNLDMPAGRVRNLWTDS